MPRRKYPIKLPGEVLFTEKLKYKRRQNYLDFIKEYQKLMIKNVKHGIAKREQS